MGTILNREVQIAENPHSGDLMTAVWRWRDNVRRNISYRRARDLEERTYRQIHGQ
jgi:uncharacterized DUF497 family protein